MVDDAKSLNVPYLNAYLNSIGTNFTHGANFAAGGATIRLPSSIIPNGLSSPFFLEVQYLQLVQFRLKSQVIKKQGGVFASLMPKDEYFSKALYTVDIGHNDIGDAFLSNMSIEQVNSSVPDMINQFSENIKNIYNLGGRSFWIHNTGPIGCLPYMLANFPGEKDEAGCLKRFNEVSQYFNFKLNESIAQLRSDFPLAAFIYVDVYSVKYSLFRSPHKYGFEFPLVACCGYGGKYNFNNSGQCGDTVAVNGTNIVVSSCDEPSVRVIWDGIHYTDSANQFVFNQIATGLFSHPPLPLKLSC
ncbi:GDSL esterase/lipase ENOD8-like [Mercurialis annua]|uniref:GDSL esterase/lipase ENOD8-like n=1 Tax=Mercurialis annua TaxID=3986 RepID=UPI00215E66FF|nr:GDSL esterase/lipase ENOD8-like [Mercurialis annua]